MQRGTIRLYRRSRTVNIVDRNIAGRIRRDPFAFRGKEHYDFHSSRAPRCRADDGRDGRCSDVFADDAGDGGSRFACPLELGRSGADGSRLQFAILIRPACAIPRPALATRRPALGRAQIWPSLARTWGRGSDCRRHNWRVDHCVSARISRRMGPVRRDVQIIQLERWHLSALRRRSKAAMPLSGPLTRPPHDISKHPAGPSDRVLCFSVSVDVVLLRERPLQVFDRKAGLPGLVQNSRLPPREEIARRRNFLGGSMGNDDRAVSVCVHQIA